MLMLASDVAGTWTAGHESSKAHSQVGPGLLAYFPLTVCPHSQAVPTRSPLQKHI